MIPDEKFKAPMLNNTKSLITRELTINDILSKGSELYWRYKEEAKPRDTVAEEKEAKPSDTVAKQKRMQSQATLSPNKRRRQSQATLSLKIRRQSQATLWLNRKRKKEATQGYTVAKKGKGGNTRLHCG